VGADRSYAPFTIGVVRLDTPDGGEVLITGEAHTIAWSTNATKGLVDNVKLLFSQDSGNTWNGLTTLTGDPGSYGWTVPYLGKNRTRCRVKVVLKDERGKTIGADTSDGDFSIKVLGIISPNGGEVLSSGSTSSIFWYEGGTETPVDEQKLLYTINGGKTWNPIVTLPGDRVSHLWQVPTVSKIKEKCKVKIILRDAEGNKVGSETSDGYFTIEPTP